MYFVMYALLLMVVHAFVWLSVLVSRTCAETLHIDVRMKQYVVRLSGASPDNGPP